MTRDDLLQLADDKEVMKVSSRDLPVVVSSRRSGGTTVAATSFLASSFGISLFATGGVGGVHREGHKTMDVSADLVELSRQPITVISSGVKSILDIPRTLEYLETQGVLVCVYDDGEDQTGCQDEEGLFFPAFFQRKSQVKVSNVMKSPDDVARLIWTRDQLKQSNGILVGNPIPIGHEVIVEEAIEEAVKDAEKNKIQGKDVTPFILNRITRLTEGSSLQANIALIQNNASLAAQSAVLLQLLRKEHEEGKFRNSSFTPDVYCVADQRRDTKVSSDNESAKRTHLDACHTKQTTRTSIQPEKGEAKNQTNRESKTTGSPVKQTQTASYSTVSPVCVFFSN